jgi:hypothetical protein
MFQSLSFDHITLCKSGMFCHNGQISRSSIVLVFGLLQASE